MKLTDSEKKYLWSKLEYTKKKKATETKNDIYQFLTGDKGEFSEDEFKKILNSLEYTFRNKLKFSELDNDNFKSIKSKLPEDWVGVKFGNLKQHQKKVENEKRLKTFEEFNDEMKIKCTDS